MKKHIFWLSFSEMGWGWGGGANACFWHMFVERQPLSNPNPSPCGVSPTAGSLWIIAQPIFLLIEPVGPMTMASNTGWTQKPLGCFQLDREPHMVPVSFWGLRLKKLPLTCHPKEGVHDFEQLPRCLSPNGRISTLGE